MSPTKTPEEEFSEEEVTARFEAALKSAMNTPHKPLKEKPKAAKETKPKKAKRQKDASN
jgi:hypothetical protein